MVTVPNDPEVLWGLGDKELTHRAFVELLTIEGRGDDPNSGIRKLYPYRVYYLRKRIKEEFERSKDQLYQKICVEFEYCKKVKEYGKTVKLLRALLDLGLIILGGADGGLVAWALRWKLLDRLCKCDKRK